MNLMASSLSPNSKQTIVGEFDIGFFSSVAQISKYMYYTLIILKSRICNLYEAQLSSILLYNLFVLRCVCVCDFFRVSFLFIA